MPYTLLAAPRTTSIRSSSSGSRVPKLNNPPGSLTGTPSMRTRAELLPPPRRKAEPCAPGAPVRATAIPGSSWSRGRSIESCRSEMRSRSRTETPIPSVESGASLRVAVTTTCSRTGTCVTVRSSDVSAPPTSARAAGSSTNPG